MADSAWATHLVHPNKEFLIDLLPDLEGNFKGWKDSHWVSDAGMFWQVGHDDGMEFNIASRQTRNILAGAPSYRPSFNAYMWADARALANIAELAGDAEKADAYRKQAEGVKARVQEKLWDPKREFFFPMFRDDETDKEGNEVKKNTLVYETGKFAGSDAGREEAGYVPWSFNLPDAGYEAAWKFLMDPEFFYAARGPVTVERNDPLFFLSDGCCWWSGQSWPFATTQTLKGMANLLQNYDQDYVTPADYLKLLQNYSLSQRKDGKPYIAEALHPDTGDWKGHDMYYRSEHYFHSGFVDLIITGLAGLKVEDSDTLTVDPLFPADWDHFAMDQIPYRGHLVAILWDKTGERYGRGAGFQILVNGEMLASQPAPGKLSVKLPPAKEVPLDPRTRVNHAVNNDGNYFPQLSASHVGQKSTLSFLQDGNTSWYHLHPPLRWTGEGLSAETDWVALDFGFPRAVDEVKLFLLDDGEGAPIAAPSSYELEYSNGGGNWKPVPGQSRTPAVPAGHMPNIVRFPEIEVTGLRVQLQNAPNRKCGMTEFEAWGPGSQPYQVAPPPAGILSFNPNPKEGFPKASASFSDRFGGTPENAIDGRIIYRANPMNRWTSYESPNESDWLEVDFGRKTTVGRIVLHIYDDHGGVRPPKSYLVERWTGNAWHAIPEQAKIPELPTGSAANTVTFPPVEASKVRVVFTHIGEGNSRSGVTEIEVWEK